MIKVDVAAPTVVTGPDGVARFVKTTSTSFAVPVPATPPLEMIPLALFSVEDPPFTIRTLATGTAVPFWVWKLVGIIGGIGPEEVKGLIIWLNFHLLFQIKIRD